MCIVQVIERTIASTPCSCRGLNGWSTTSSPIMPGGGVSMEDDWTVAGIEVTPTKSCGVFGALDESNGKSWKYITHEKLWVFQMSSASTWFICLPIWADVINISATDQLNQLVVDLFANWFAAENIYFHQMLASTIRNSAVHYERKRKQTSSTVNELFGSVHSPTYIVISPIVASCSRMKQFKASLVNHFGIFDGVTFCIICTLCNKLLALSSGFGSELDTTIRQLRKCRVNSWSDGYCTERNNSRHWSNHGSALGMSKCVSSTWMCGNEEIR